MRIFLKIDVINDRESWTWLNRILSRIEDGAHEWEIENTEIYEDSDWINQISFSHKELYFGAAKKSSYPLQTGIHFKTVIVSKEICGKSLSPEIAARFVYEPITILMENQFTDGILLDSAIDFLAKDSVKNFFRSNIYKPIEYIGVGGNGELPKYINKAIEKSKETGIPNRIIVFTDSDKTREDDIQRNSQLVGEACIKNNIKYCILKKRSIENYIPNEIFKKWLENEKNKGHKAKIDALIRLNTEQRDYISIKKGIKKQNPLDPLFSDLTEDDVNSLSTGFGDNVIEWLISHKESLTGDALRNRDQTGDLEEILKLIEEEI